MKTTISKALKLKKQLTGLIKKQEENIIENNSILKDGIRKVDVKEEIKLHSKAVEELIRLKTTLYKFNMKVQKDIYRMMELNAELSMWKDTPCDEGKVQLQQQSATYRGIVNGETEPAGIVEKTAELKYQEIYETRKRIASEIDSIQIKLEHHNHSDLVEISDELINLLEN